MHLKSVKEKKGIASGQKLKVSMMYKLVKS